MSNVIPNNFSVIFLSLNSGGEGTLQSFTRGGSPPQFKPLTLLYTILTEKVLLLHTY